MAQQQLNMQTQQQQLQSQPGLIQQPQLQPGLVQQSQPQPGFIQQSQPQPVLVQQPQQQQTFVQQPQPMALPQPMDMGQTGQQFEQHLVEQGSVTLMPDRVNVQITNHDSYRFQLTLQDMDQIAKAFDESCRMLMTWARDKEVRTKKDVQNDLKTYDIRDISSTEKVRLVVRKINKRIYMSCGIYTKESGNSYYSWANTRNLRLDYFNDDLLSVVKEMKLEATGL